MTHVRGAYAVALIALVFAVLAGLRADRISADLRNQRYGDCSLLFAQANAPAAPGAAKDAGARETAAAARESYHERACEKHGFSKLPGEE